MAEVKMEKVVGLNCHAKIGQRVQLTEQGRKSLDERFHNISGGKAGTITAVLGDGALATVRWDISPNEEHQYRVGRFGRFELSIYDGPDVAPSPQAKQNTLRNSSRSALESISDKSNDEDDTLRLSRSSMESESETVASTTTASFSTDAFREHLAKNAAAPHPLLGLQPTFKDTFGGAYTGPPSSSLRPSNKDGNANRYKNPLHKSSLRSTASSSTSLSAAAGTGGPEAAHRNPQGVSPSTTAARAEPSSANTAARPLSVQFDTKTLLAEDSKAAAAGRGEGGAKGHATSSASPSLMSVVVKNPLRQGLEWAGEGSQANKDQGSGAGGSGAEAGSEYPSLMSVLVRRPLRGGLALAEQLQQSVARDGAASDAANARDQGAGERGVGGAEAVKQGVEDGAPTVAGTWKKMATGNTDNHATSRLPGRGVGGGGQHGDGGGGRGWEHGGGDMGEDGRRNFSEQGTEREVERERVSSLMSVVVKQPLRRSGWLEKESERRGDGAGADAREASLLSLVDLLHQLCPSISLPPRAALVREQLGGFAN